VTSESALIERIRAIFASHGVRGEDEDGDAWRVESLLASHVTTDMVVEGVDFDRALYPVRFAGHRALAQNLSDLYAVDAEPVAFIWSLAIPRSWSADDVAAFAEGAARLAQAVQDIHYGNFKSGVKETDRHDTYMEVWDAMYRFQKAEKPGA
jgi:thiamine-monophosphate kinase